MRLKQEHWSLIFDNVSNASKSKLIQGDFVSVNHSEQMKRLSQICNVSINDEPLNNLRKMRNKFEHFEVQVSVYDCKKAIAEALQVTIEFWDVHILPICSDEQSEKLATIKSLVTNFDTYIEIKMQEQSQIIKQIVDSGAGILTPCNNCKNLSFLVFKKDDKKCKCIVCNHSLHKNEYIQEVREYENRSFSLLPKDEYEIQCHRCNHKTRVKFHPKYSTEAIAPDYYYCLSCLHYEREPTIAEQVEKELEQRIKRLEKNHTLKEIIQILENEI